MEIVEHEHDRPALGGVPQELGGRIEQAKARSFGLERERLGQVGEALAQLGNDLGEIRGAGPEL